MPEPSGSLWPGSIGRQGARAIIYREGLGFGHGSAQATTGRPGQGAVQAALVSGGGQGIRDVRAGGNHAVGAWPGLVDEAQAGVLGPRGSVDAVGVNDAVIERQTVPTGPRGRASMQLPPGRHGADATRTPGYCREATCGRHALSHSSDVPPNSVLSPRDSAIRTNPDRLRKPGRDRLTPRPGACARPLPGPVSTPIGPPPST